MWLSRHAVVVHRPTRGAGDTIFNGTFKQQARRAIEGFCRTLGGKIAGLVHR